MKFLLFDIDGTLIDSGGAGVRSLNLAFEDLFAIPDAFRTVNMAGKTDLLIGNWNNHFVHVPMKLLAGKRKHVDPRGMLWRSALEATGQGSLKN